MRPPRASRPSIRCAIAAIVFLGVAGGSAAAQDLQSELDSTEAELGQAREKKGVLSSELERYDSQITQLAGEVATLRNREAIVEQQLRETQQRLERELQRLEQLRAKLTKSRNDLRERLVEIYRSDPPDLVTVLLESEGFDSMVTRFEYLRRIEEQDASIVSTVRGLRDEAVSIVAQVRADRDAIAAKEAELERTRVQLEAREAELEQVRAQKANALGEVEKNIERLEGDVSELSDKIAKQLQAEASTTASSAVPAGPIQGAANGFIWPIDAVLTSPFGPRWGRLHAGLDLAAPGGTPIRATRGGTVTMAEYYGGYGNYTCVDHGGGVSSCYAHQSELGTAAGASVETGDVIGFVGTTGSSTGDHLHFEIRVDGNPVDPMGYLG